MNGITIYEFDALTAESGEDSSADGLYVVSERTYIWLEDICLRSADGEGVRWARLTQRQGRRAVQVTSFVGVIRTPDGFQIEVLPKIGKSFMGGKSEARRLLVDMLCCLQTFRHVQTDNAKILAARMPLLEVFIAEYLRLVMRIVKIGLRSDYCARQENLFSLRGKLLVAPHLRQNLHRADRFFTEHDEFLADRPENRLLHAALNRVLNISASQSSQKLARELKFVFAEIPVSRDCRSDFQCVRTERGMGCYADALAWARLILEEASPLTGMGGHHAPSLLFPMEALFEAFVAKHLARQMARSYVLKDQVRRNYMVRHREEDWFRLQPDLLVADTEGYIMVLDTKWKLLDARLSSPSRKYGLSQADFYQLQAYGLSYLSGQGDVVLIYPKTDSFESSPSEFQFKASSELRLWVVPFCLKSKRLLCPINSGSSKIFEEIFSS